MKKIFYVPLVSVMLIACSKYEDGPDFSILTKKERLSNNWTVSEAIHESGDNANFQDSYVNFQFNIGIDKNYTISYKPNGIDNYCEMGTWEFNSDKTHFVTTNASGKTIDYTILRLAKNQLWVRFSDQGNDWVLHLWPKPQG
jgi:hypothetical protein